jgi:hypothetical protein
MAVSVISSAQSLISQTSHPQSRRPFFKSTYLIAPNADSSFAIKSDISSTTDSGTQNLDTNG